MQIAYERSGGFAGLTLVATVDVGALPPALARSATEADWAALPSRSATPTRSDGVEHRLEVTGSGRRRHRVVLSESAVPVELRPLLAELQARAVPQP